MAAQTRVVIEDAQQNGISPLPVLQEYPQRAVMEVQVPEGVDMLAFIAADFTALKAALGSLGSRAAGRTSARAFEEAVGFRETQNRSIGRLGSQLGVLFQDRQQIVGMELVAPVGMLLVLGGQLLAQLGAHRRMAALIATSLAPQGFQWILFFIEGDVIPPLNGRETKVGPLPANGMKRFLGGQFLEFGLEFSALGRRGQ